MVEKNVTRAVITPAITPTPTAKRMVERNANVASVQSLGKGLSPKLRSIENVKNTVKNADIVSRKALANKMSITFTTGMASIGRFNTMESAMNRETYMNVRQGNSPVAKKSLRLSPNGVLRPMNI